MPKINILPKNISELIAAGEVVERPASVVKELVENSIDAGATTVTAEIKNGGITYIRITDNGCGINHEDVPKAFISHATSKVSSAEDLNNIFTLGFRGEALASVAAVSKTEMFTKASDEQYGTSYAVEGGDETRYENAGCPNGTTIVVRDLFYNTPARMKFLKKDVSEANAVADVIDKLAISHPEISFRFIRDGKQTLLTPGDNKLISAVYAVYGKQFSDSLIAVDYTLDGVKVNGYTSKPINSRSTRAMQIFFLNGRYIKSRSCMASLENAYKNSIMVGKFPACVLNISVPLESVDVNVHPTKTEVRFSDEKRVYSAVYYAVKSAVENFDTRPKFDVSKPIQRAVAYSQQLHMSQESADCSVTIKPKNEFRKSMSSQEYSSVAKVSSVVNENPFLNQSDEPDLISDKIMSKHSFSNSFYRNFENNSSANNSGFEKDANSASNFNALQKTVIGVKEDKQPLQIKIIGEAFKTYIVCEFENKLCLIDKHAAHERIIFNKLKSLDLTQNRQLLLSSAALTLGKKEYNTIINNLEVFKNSGFLIEDFGNGAVIIRECPMLIDVDDAQDIVLEICESLLVGKTDTSSDKIDMMLHTTACKAAIKAGNNNSLFELEKLAKEIINNKEVRYCPHGRPVMIEITQYELEKQFKRIQ